ncbi:uncharacterized protein LTR77_008810 [Saxophila tyrrhenica]|uniref:p-hydroxylaminobenzoate lyase n=1 Tax=Saxophila tyrrhenica TaxID=1690608 RepID=A0AAV9P0C2_9PEZI|nr:hypothetical protein LTR77_008810 [Saxophila tyrrhenica]
MANEEVYQNAIKCKACDHDGSTDGIDTATHPAAQKLAARALEFLKEIKDFTPGKALEQRLNRDYGPGNPYFEDFCRLLKQGFEEGWIASRDLDSGMYRIGNHKHPYGEINCIVPIDPSFQIEGLPVGENWQGAGWTSPGPGTHHYPRARGGRGLEFFLLPSGRITFDAKPEEPQPVSI